ncbi:MAG TPA: SNF2-related protein, partial [Ktedonobacteraceae bacterium]
MAMRTGKTKVTLDDFGTLFSDDEVDDIFVLAPAGVYRTWEKAIKEHVAKSLQKILSIHLWDSHKKSQREQRIMAAFLKPDVGVPRMLIMNIEALSSVEAAYKLAKEFLSQRRVYFVVDESTTIKNDSIRTDRALKLGPLADYRRILTGLISPRSPLDVYFQFQFLEPGCLGHRTFSTFKARYADEVKVCTLPTGLLHHKLLRATGNGRIVVDGMTVSVADLSRQETLDELDRRNIWYDRFPKITGYKNETELRDILSQHSYRVRLEDCYDLPPKMYSYREVGLTAEQKRIYKSLKETATAELDSMEHVTALSVVSRIIRLHQVLCGHTRDEAGKLHEIPERRTAQMMEVLEETEGKAIIWCSYDYNVRKVSEAIEKEYGEGSCARFWGGNVRTREREEESFQNDPHCRFMVGTPSAGGRGRLWVAADLVVYYSNTNNLEHRSQSEERA